VRQSAPYIVIWRCVVCNLYCLYIRRALASVPAPPKLLILSTALRDSGKGNPLNPPCYQGGLTLCFRTDKSALKHKAPAKRDEGGCVPLHYAHRLKAGAPFRFTHPLEKNNAGALTVEGGLRPLPHLPPAGDC
jgi:hypothetical protein